jgi:hypothetical protein
VFPLAALEPVVGLVVPVAVAAGPFVLEPPLDDPPVDEPSEPVGGASLESSLQPSADTRPNVRILGSKTRIALA